MFLACGTTHPAELLPESIAALIESRLQTEPEPGLQTLIDIPIDNPVRNQAARS
ncbi:hypothetical protein [Phaffia rhodozyma]|uniref:Uncharacterized protein n=1 Tax=Phaffia rhodozyma TaxID=264483 RepID=A0A0F7SF91_PHARH|nr:hypothetical protein [Phaffia rhodozyma]